MANELKVDPLAVMADAADQLDNWAKDSGLTKSQFSPELRQARAAVAELLEAAEELIDARPGEANWNRINAATARVRGDHNG